MKLRKFFSSDLGFFFIVILWFMSMATLVTVLINNNQGWAVFWITVTFAYAFVSIVKGE